MQHKIFRNLEMKMEFDFTDEPEYDRPVYTENYGTIRQARVSKITFAANLEKVDTPIRTQGRGFLIKKDGTTGQQIVRINYGSPRELDPISQAELLGVFLEEYTRQRKELGLGDTDA